MSQGLVRTEEISGKTFLVVEARLTYRLEEHVFKWGEVELSFDDGTTLPIEGIFDLFDALSALCWSQPQSAREFLGTIVERKQKYMFALREAQKSYMQRKYPGWNIQGAPSGRAKAAPEEVKSETINVEDLGL